MTFIITLILLSACNLDRRTDEEFQAVIKEHETELLFLSFWPEMNDQDFERTIKYENSLGNLENGNFIFSIKLNTSITKVPFRVRNLGHGVDLYYSDSYETPYNGNRAGSENDGSGKGQFYHGISSSIEEILNENYEFLGRKNYNSYWKSVQEPCKVVELYSSIDYFRYNNSGSNYYSHNEEKTKVYSASCLLTVEYMTCERFNQIIEADINKELEAEENKKRELNEAEENNNKL